MKLLIVIIVLSLLSTTIQAQNKNYKQVNSFHFDSLIHSGKGMILDVRTKSEFKGEHIKNSGNLNYYALDFKKKLDLLNKETPIYLYCNTGYRSEKTAKILIKKGFKNVYNLEHGIMEWNHYDLPVVENQNQDKNQPNRVSIEFFNDKISIRKLVLVDFYAPWCGPCRKMMPLIDSIKTEYYPDMEVFKVNSDASKKLIKEEQIIGVPLFRLYRNNTLLFEKSGMMTRKELKKEIEKNL